MTPKSEAPPHPSTLSFAIIGAGRVGLSLGHLLSRSGYRIESCFARSDASAEEAQRWLGIEAARDIHSAAEGADCLLLTVPDSAIETVCTDLTSKGSITEGTFVVHTAGAFGIAPLKPSIEAGGRAVAFHPLQSVPDVQSGVDQIPGSWVGITCEPMLTAWAEALAEAVGCRTFRIPEERRGVYHAAAAMASNYLVTLSSLVADAFGNLEPFIPLMQGTLANVERMGPAGALTGAIVRGDVETIQRHLDSLGDQAPDLVPYYKDFGRATLDLATRTGRLEEEKRVRVAELLSSK